MTSSQANSLRRIDVYLMSSETLESFSKLTVPQLRAICKEKKIIGYSKLGKAALLEKLQSSVGFGNGSVPASESTFISKQISLVHAVSATPPVESLRLTKTREGAQVYETKATQFSPPSASSLETISVTKNNEKDIPTSSSTPPAYITENTHAIASKNDMGRKTWTGCGVHAIPRKAEDNLDSNLMRPKKKQCVNSSIDKESGCAAHLGSSNMISEVSMPPKQHITISTEKKQHAYKAVVHTKPRVQTPLENSNSANVLSQTKSATRFKPLRVIQKENYEQQTKKGASHTNSPHLESHMDRAVDLGLDYLEFRSIPFIALNPISLPPSLSQRKLVQAMSIILSGLGPPERRQCLRVSRTFRYAVYLSATNIIKKDYSDQVYLALSHRYKLSMINCWPYLQLLTDELGKRLQAYYSSYLPRFFGKWNPICRELWSYTDATKLSIALRFVVTRMWFAVSLGGKDRDVLMRTVVKSSEEVVKDEIWRISVETYGGVTSISKKQAFYILAQSCEVIGIPSSSDTNAPNCSTLSKVFTLRADWSEYIRYRSLPSGFHDLTPPPLISYLKWTNAEEYEKGISKIWLTRVSKEGPTGEYLRRVAERYILACVVGNSVSGLWMSSSHMAQVFAGTSTSEVPLGMRKKEVPRVNLFLPAHHLIESVHFTANGGKALHPAIAVVQTPNREYYVLRDNGMEIGCEEDGVWPVWAELLRCNRYGFVP